LNLINRPYPSWAIRRGLDKVALSDKVGEGESLTKALRSEAGTVPLGLPRGERSEDRERIFLAGKNSRLSQGLS